MAVVVNGTGKEKLVFDSEQFVISRALLVKPSLGTQIAQGAVVVGGVGLAAKFGLLWPVVPGVMTVVCCSWYAVCGLSQRFSSWFGAWLIPTIMPMVDKTFKNVRKEQLKGIQGRVLDVGSGSGLYIQYAALSSHVTEYIALEPNTGMHSKIQANAVLANPQFPLRIIGGYLEHIREDESFDSIILGNVMCEIPNQEAGLLEVARLLKPGGRVYFCEHVLEEWPSIGHVMQRSLNWWWVTVSAGCNCNRRTLHEMARVWRGWSIAHWTFRLGRVGLVTRMEIGVATKPNTK
eukprot:c12617_g3_i1.p1 GENE.c12617_g3_i1~~c12617_g3_i1.p1  ORF type:complete len:332 (-),score=91.61 c12617_g3_i1:61-933(-)